VIFETEPLLQQWDRCDWPRGSAPESSVLPVLPRTAVHLSFFFLFIPSMRLLATRLCQVASSASTVGTLSLRLRSPTPIAAVRTLLILLAILLTTLSLTHRGVRTTAQEMESAGSYKYEYSSVLEQPGIRAHGAGSTIQTCRTGPQSGHIPRQVSKVGKLPPCAAVGTLGQRSQERMRCACIDNDGKILPAGAG
jgi:hypothetical protein